jgi:sugar phosphate isomerase/epimerase
MSAIDLDLELGFTLGLALPFEETVEWAAEAGFAFVELLLDATTPSRSGRPTSRRCSKPSDGPRTL